MSPPQSQIPVLIIGGGIVGICSSLFLSLYNIPSIVIERHSGPSTQPRARGVNARTMELLRHLGLEEKVYEAGKSISASFGVYKGTTLKGIMDNTKRRPEVKPGEEEKTSFIDGLITSISPTRGTFVTQDMLEPMLIKTAIERGVDVRFYTESQGIEQDDEGVTATIKDRKTGEISTIRAAYLIASDGARSPIRNQLNIPTTGRGKMGHLLNILFTADLQELVARREFFLCIIDRPGLCGLFTSINNSDRWGFHLYYDPSKGETPADYPPERCKGLVEAALGMPDVKVEVKGVMPWEPSVRVAKYLNHGRVFLAGDAAHQMPPYAGQGANTGIGDAHNLVWKLAAVLTGKADKRLLDTYNAERLHVGREAAEASAAGSDERGLISIDKTPSVIAGFARKIYRTAGYGYGYAYTDGALCKEDMKPLGGLSWKPWTLPSLVFAIDGRVGRRVPHVWVDQKGERVSTLDLCGTMFTLLAGAQGDVWLEAAKAMTAKLGFQIAAFKIGQDGDSQAPPKVFENAAGITSHGAILVRPDAFVGWRARRTVCDSEKVLEKAMMKMLCR